MRSEDRGADRDPTLLTRCDHPDLPLPASRRLRKAANEPGFEIRTPLFTLCGGVDLTQLPGVGTYAALKLISEVGLDMSRWATETHFVSWLTLSPNVKISGGKLLSSRTQPSANRAAKIFRLSAMSLGRSDHALGAFYRRLAVRIGKAKAITATARKLAILFYRTLTHKLLCPQQTAEHYDRRHRTRLLRSLRQRARTEVDPDFRTRA